MNAAKVAKENEFTDQLNRFKVEDSDEDKNQVVGATTDPLAKSTYHSKQISTITSNGESTFKFIDDSSLQQFVQPSEQGSSPVLIKE